MIKNFKTFITEQRASFNRGDVAEAIFASAVAAKFIVKPEAKVHRTDVEKVLSKLLFDQKDTTSRADKDGTTIDRIKLFVKIPKKSFEFIHKKENWKLVDDLWDSSLDKVNNDKSLRKFARQFFNNNRQNDISVSASGTENQKTTKVDIFLTIDGKRTSNQVSLKTAGGEQFGQSPANEFSDFEKVFSSGFNINIGPAHKEWKIDTEKFDRSTRYQDRSDETLDHQKKIYKAAVKKLFTFVTEKINDLKNAGEIELVDYLIKFIRKYATLDDWKFVEFVKLDKRKAQTLKFGKQFERKMKSYDLIANLRMDGDPTIRIHEKTTGKEVIQIRLKIESASTKAKAGTTYRVYSRMLFELPGNSILWDKD